MTILLILLQISKRFTLHKDKSLHIYVYTIVFIYLEMHKLMHKLSKFISFFCTVQVCPVRNTWSPKYLCVYTHIYIVLKTRLNLCVTLTCFFLVLNAKMPRDEGTNVRITKIPAHPSWLRITYPISIFDMPEDSPLPVPLRLRGVQRKEVRLAEVAARAEIFRKKGGLFWRPGEMWYFPPLG